MLNACLVAVALAATSPAISNQDVASELAAARGFGAPGAITGTPDGKYIFAAQGASLTIIQPGRELAPSRSPDRNFDEPIKAFELGEFRPHVVRMILDPDADLDDGTSLAAVGHPSYRNYVLIAAGPNGLWIADADKNPGVVNRIARVDDSAGDSGAQTSDRHCNDVDVVTLRGQSFVVATFAARGDSLLRFYRLEDVRGVLGAAGAAPSETGREIAPLLTVQLGAYLTGTPFSSLAIGPRQIARSYASEFVVDQGDSMAEEAYVYVAMRTDGVVRVRVRHGEIMNGTASTNAVAWGPRFGDGSYYATYAPPAPYSDHREVYDNVRWINQQFAPDRVERSDPPYVTALALHRAGRDAAGRQQGHKLYAGVDGLGIVVFDLSDPTSWGQTMPIDHHEGVPLDLQGGGKLSNPGAWPERIVGTADPKGASSIRELIGYVRGLAVVDSPSGLALVALHSGVPSIGDSPLFLEGFAYDDQFQFGGVAHSVPMRGTKQGFVRIISVSDFPQGSPEIQLTAGTEVEAGGAGLFVPSVQSNQLGGDSPKARLELAHTGFSEIGMTSVRVDAQRDAGPIVATRERRFIAGRRTFGLQQSLVDPDLIMTSDNDGYSREGLLYLLGSPGNRSLAVDYDGAAPGGNDQRLSSGVIMGRRSQWLDSRLGSNQQAVIAGGRARAAGAGLPARPATHMVSIQTIPSGFGESPSIEEFQVNLLQKPDRWNRVGRAFYLGGMVDARYDSWVQENVPGLASAEYFFLFRQETPDGLLFGRRDALMDLVTGGTVADGQYLTPAQLAAAGVELRSLSTHPEFDQFPSHPSDPGYRAAAAWFGQSATPHPYRQRLKTWEPEMIRVRPAKGSGVDVGWVLAAPCGVGVLGSTEDPDLADVGLSTTPYRRLEQVSVTVTNGEIVSGDPQWLPDEGSLNAEGFGRGLVQFWDFTHPANVPVVPGRPDGSSSLGRIHLPIASEANEEPNDVGRSSFAWHLEGLEVERKGRLHSYAVVGDFLGAVHAYEISSILDGAAPVLQDSWYAPPSSQDVLTNNVRDVVLDRDGGAIHAYVAVQRIGVVVLRLEVSSSGALTMTEVSRLADIKEPLTLHLRVIEGTGERLLYVCDHRQAMRVYSSISTFGDGLEASARSRRPSPRTLPTSLTISPKRPGPRKETALPATQPGKHQ